MFFRSYERELGCEARLGISFYLLDANGSTIQSTGYQKDWYLPMASTMKVAVALTVLKEMLIKKEFDLNTKVIILDSEFIPGPPTNSLDRNYFFPWNCDTEKTIDELLTFMLTESDNTATDKLLSIICGPNEVNKLMVELEIPGYNLTRCSSELTSDYYEIDTHKSVINIFKTIYEYITAFNMRSTEKDIFSSNRDSCTPNSMSLLLKLLLNKSAIDDGEWLSQAAKIICQKMQQCKTGPNMIKKAADNYVGYYNQFGHKTGGLGGIKNDVAYIKLKNGQTIILSIYTCLSSLALSHREAIISKIALDILNENIGNNINQETVLINKAEMKKSFCGIL